MSVPRVAIVDYSLGNLFSVKHACDHVGLHAWITSDKHDLEQADAVILPGVGAFGDAMECLRRLDLVRPLQDISQSDRLLVGICLGQQLLMSESYEFGRHQGLGIIEGDVVRLENPTSLAGPLKVPQVGWNRIHPKQPGTDAHGHVTAWQGTPLAPIADGEFMYFVHSYFVRPAEPDVVLAVTRYGQIEFCSAIKKGNVIAFQFHPERSSIAGMQIYRYLAESLHQRIGTKETRHAA